MKTIEDRFEEKWTPEPNTGCYLWTAGVDRYGYGKLWVNGKTVLSHRFAWELVNGPIPEGMCVCHKCDVRSCVNIDHLFIGTHDDNMKDMVQKKRAFRSIGEKDGMAKLTEEQVLDIRKKYVKGTGPHNRGNTYQLAAEFGVSQYYINRIGRRERWKHV
jgi:hypothetical protein